MYPMDVAPLSGLVVTPPMVGLLPVGDRGAPLGGTPPTWLLRLVVDLGLPPPVLRGLSLVPALSMGGVVAFTVGRSSFASSSRGWSVHVIIAHVFIALDITMRFHQAAIVLTGCLSLVVERHA
jgi:hypothetical protein